MKRLLTLFLIVALGVPAALASPNGWQANPDINAEVGIVGNTITVGVPGDAEGDYQPVAVHGATMALPPAQAYKVTFNYDLRTWDSYNAPGTPNPPWWGGTGYWDSFTVSVSQSEYWNLSLADPVNGDPLAVGFLWDGASYGDGFLESTSGSAVVTIPASTTSTNYLNVVLDTATLPSNNGNYPSWGIFEIVSVALLVYIDIKPGSYPNSISPSGGGVIPVAILTAGGFDASTVDASTVTFGPAAATKIHEYAHLEDADADGDIDMVLHFKTQDTGISAGDFEATLTGQTVDGQAIIGTDSVRTVPPEG